MIAVPVSVEIRLSVVVRRRTSRVTLRLLYPTPTIAVTWEKKVPRRRVRMWTVETAT